MEEYIGALVLLAVLVLSWIKKMWDNRDERAYEQQRQHRRQEEQRTESRVPLEQKPGSAPPSPSRAEPTPVRSLQLEQARQRREAALLAKRLREQAVQQIARALPDQEAVERKTPVQPADQVTVQVRRERERTRRMVVEMLRQPRSFRTGFLFSEIIGPPKSTP